MLMFEYIDLIRNNFNKKAAKIHTKNISKFYRSHGSKGYEDAFNYIYNEEIYIIIPIIFQYIQY